MTQTPCHLVDCSQHKRRRMTTWRVNDNVYSSTVVMSSQNRHRCSWQKFGGSDWIYSMKLFKYFDVLMTSTSLCTNDHYKSQQLTSFGYDVADISCELQFIIIPNTRLIDWLHGLTSPPTQYRLYGRRFFTGQKTQPTVSEYPNLFFDTVFQGYLYAVISHGVVMTHDQSV